MAQIYNQFRINSYDEATGQVTLIWYDDQSPIGGQTILERGHKIPLEAETNNWTRTQLLAWWVNEVEDIADISQWMKDEANATRSAYKLVAEIV
jgi:hypothetical protein